MSKPFPLPPMLVLDSGDPWVQLAVGRRGSGKTYAAIAELRAWRDAHAEAKRKALVFDPVYTEPTQPHQLAHWADYIAAEDWDGTIPPDVGLIVVDEADVYASEGELSRRPIAPLADIILRGRHRGISIYLCTQRPQQVAYRVRALADRIVICHTTGKRDLDALCELEGVAPGRANIATAQRQGPVCVWTPYGVSWSR